MRIQEFFLVRRLPALLLSAPLAVAVAQDAAVTLISPPAGFHAPTGEIHLALTNDLRPVKLEQIGLEMDGIDVTDFVVKEPDRLVFSPVRPLHLGEHQLRLVEYRLGGEPIEHGLWTFEVRDSARFRERTAGFDLEMDSAQRVADARLANQLDRFQQQGGLALYSGLADRKWSLRSKTEFIYSSREELTLNGDPFDLASYLVSGTGGPLQYSIGHHDIGARNLILNRFNRRGISASLPIGTPKSRLTGFVMRTEKITGFQNGFGFSDSGNHTTGATWSVNPFVDPKTLEVSATWIDASGTEVGKGGIGDSTGQEGDAWSVAARGRAWDGRLRLGGEYAETRFDFDGSGTGPGKVGDDAFSLTAEFSRRPETGNGANVFLWTVGAKHQEVGTLYRSLGNSRLPNDKRLTRAYTEMSLGGWALDAAVARDSDNVADLIDLPQVENDYYDIHTVYSPRSSSAGGDGWSVFGMPTFDITYSHVRQDQTFTPLNFMGFVTDTRTQTLNISALFAHSRGSWGILLTRGEFDDFSDLFPDTRQNLAGLSGHVMLDDRSSFGGNLLWNEIDEDTGRETTTVSGDLNLSVIFLPDRLNSSLRGTVIQEDTSDGFIDLRRFVLSGDLQWSLVLPGPNRPDLSLWLSASYQDEVDKGVADFSLNQYQLFLGLKLSWSAST